MCPSTLGALRDRVADAGTARGYLSPALRMLTVGASGHSYAMDSTRISVSTRQRLCLTVGLMAVGTAVGALVGLLTEFILSLTHFSGFFGIAAHTGEPIGIVIVAFIGMVLGIVGAATIIAESLHVDIADDEMTMSWKGATVRVRKDLVSAIHLGEDLVLYCRNGIELARARAVDPQRLRCSLIHHGFPTPSVDQQGEDEFTCDYSILDENEQRIVAARQNALRAGNCDIAEIFRRQLAGMGIMTRDVRTGRMSVRMEVRRLDPFRDVRLTA